MTNSNPPEERRSRVSVKLIVAGSPGAGTSTFIASAADEPRIAIDAERAVTDNGNGSSRTSWSRRSTPIRPSMGPDLEVGTFDLGRELRVSIFALPSSERYWFLWPRLAAGSLGSLLLVDPDRLTASRAVALELQQLGLPTLTVLNASDGRTAVSVGDTSEALGLGPGDPVTSADLRRKAAAQSVVGSLLRHAVTLAAQTTGSTASAATV